MPEPDFATFQLLPDSGEAMSADEELAAFIDPDDIEALTLDPAVEAPPANRTWYCSFDPFELSNNPQVVTGVATVVQWAQLALRIQARQFPIFPDNIGMDAPDRLISHVDDAERRADYFQDIEATLYQNDRITNISPVAWSYDDDDELAVATIEIEIDGDETVSLEVPLL